MKAQTGLTFWMRFDGHHFEVAHTDAAILWFARCLEQKETDTDVASRADYAGMLLNVIADDDGWAYTIMSQRGYENQDVRVGRQILAHRAS